MAIQNSYVVSSASNVYVSSGNTVVSTMYFCNNGASAVNLNVYLVPAASGPVNTSNVQIYNNIQLAAGDTYVTEFEKLVLGNTDMIRANASGAVTATVSYIGI